VVAALLVVGVFAEFVGIVLLGFPDFVPGALRLSGWLRRYGRRLANVVRSLFGRPTRGAVHQIRAAGESNVSATLSAVVIPKASTLEEKVDYLMSRDQAAQDRVNTLDERIVRLETDSPRRLAEARRKLEDHVTRELVAAEAAYRPLRVAGTVALAVGLACSSLASYLASH